MNRQTLFMALAILLVGCVKNDPRSGSALPSAAIPAPADLERSLRCAGSTADPSANIAGGDWRTIADEEMADDSEALTPIPFEVTSYTFRDQPFGKVIRTLLKDMGQPIDIESRLEAIPVTGERLTGTVSGVLDFIAGTAGAKWRYDGSGFRFYTPRERRITGRGSPELVLMLIEALRSAGLEAVRLVTSPKSDSGDFEIGYETGNRGAAAKTALSWLTPIARGIAWDVRFYRLRPTDGEIDWARISEANRIFPSRRATTLIASSPDRALESLAREGSLVEMSKERMAGGLGWELSARIADCGGIAAWQDKGIDLAVEHFADQALEVRLSYVADGIARGPIATSLTPEGMAIVIDRQNLAGWYPVMTLRPRFIAFGP